MLFIAWNKIGSKHASDQVRFKTYLANWSQSHVTYGWKQVESKYAFQWSSQFESNLASWGWLHVVHRWNQIENKHTFQWSNSIQIYVISMKSFNVIAFFSYGWNYLKRSMHPNKQALFKFKPKSIKSWNANDMWI
jgi:hypothetical protein